MWLAGLQTLMAARPTVKVTNAPDAAEIIMALVSKGSKDMNAVVGLINALATKPNITMPTVALNIPQINMPNIPMPEINLPQMPSIDLNTIVSVITALQGKRCAGHYGIDCLPSCHETQRFASSV